MLKELTAVARREFIEIRRAGFLMVIIGAVGPAVFCQGYMLFWVHKALATVPKDLRGVVSHGVITQALLFVPPIVILSFCNLFTTRSLSRDRLQGSLAEVLVTGVPAGVVWLGKVAAIFAASYIWAILTVAATGLSLIYGLGLTFAASPSLLVAIVISGPLCALMAVAVSTFCAFVNAKLLAPVAAFIPGIGAFFLFFFGAHSIIERRALSLLSLNVAAACAVLVLICLALLVNRVKIQTLLET